MLPVCVLGEQNNKGLLLSPCEYPFSFHSSLYLTSSPFCFISNLFLFFISLIHSLCLDYTPIKLLWLFQQIYTGT